MSTHWPFKDAPNTATLVSRYVLEGERICFAYRDWDDGTWQFFPDHATDANDTKLVCLKEVYQLDESIGELADLRVGWMATRGSGSGWTRKKNHPFPVFRDDGFYLDDATEYERLNPKQYKIPCKATRENLRVGDIVKLIFRFADEWCPRGDNQCERMWVEICEVDGENLSYRGILVNDPSLHNQIVYGHELWFHPIHIFDIREEKSS